MTEEIKDALEAYRLYLQKQPVSQHTKRNYHQRVAGFLKWLAGTSEGSLALSDSIERDFQLREYKFHLLQRGASASTVNSVLAALDNLSLSRGMAPGRLKRLTLPQTAPRSLEPEEEKRLFKVLARTNLRNRTVILLFWHTGLRVSELAALNHGDLTLTARTGQLVVRCGKGLKQRIIPLNAEAREALQLYFAKSPVRKDCDPLFLSQKRTRLSVSSIDRIVRKIGNMAGIELSCHDLRHSFARRLLKAGLDAVLVSELLGHSRIELLTRYGMPSQAEKQEAMERICNAS